MATWMIVLGVVVVLALWVMSIYNSLVSQRNQVKNGWAQIDVQLQRRYDLIPNLVETVKGYMAHEKSTLQEVIQARNQAVSARESVEAAGGPVGTSLAELSAAEGTLTGALGRIFALAESYPDLKANTTMSHLQEELSSTENKVAFSRQAYNDLVLAYNTYQQQLPAAVFAGAFGHQLADLFEVQSAEAKEAVKVSF